jgi:RimJ/RimL family protein N-acetyltransferase
MIAKYKGKKYVLKGKKCILEGIVEKDLPKFVKWLRDDRVNRYLSRDYSKQTLKDEKKWYNDTIKGKSEIAFGIYAMEDRKKKLIGSTTLMKIDDTHKNAEFGIVIGDMDYWGKGIGSEVTNMIIDFGFKVVNLNSIYLTVDKSNKAGQKIYRRAGFKKAGVLREHVKRKKGYSETIVMDFIRKDWKK